VQLAIAGRIGLEYAHYFGLYGTAEII
jgi:hypothetical protein